MPPVEHLNLVRPSHVPCEPNTARAKDATLLVELYERTKVEGFAPSRFLAERITAVVAGVSHVVVLQPAFARLITNRTIDRMMEKKKLHGVPYRLMDSFSISADF